MKSLYICCGIVKDVNVEVEKMKTLLTDFETKQCIVCDSKQEKGIFLYNGFICESCEREIVQTDTDDVRYLFYLQQLRKIQLPKI